jgi:soluble P-type ATPase
VLANKLKALKVNLKKWNVEVFSDVGKKKKELLEGIRELECIDEDQEFVEERVRKTDMIRELKKTLLF